MMVSRFRDTHVFREARLSLGVDDAAGGFYLSIPVSNVRVDYEEYYRLSAAEYRRLATDAAARARFAEECRRRERDELLILRPGTDRGAPG